MSEVLAAIVVVYVMVMEMIGFFFVGSHLGECLEILNIR